MTMAKKFMRLVHEIPSHDHN